MTSLSPNFSLGEFADDRRESSIPASVVPALRATAAGLERARRIIGAPLRVTDGWRSQAENADTPGSSATSHHLTGYAADVVPIGVPIDVAARRVLDDLGALGDFDEFLIYPGHLHFAFAPSNRRKVLRRIVTAGRSYWAPATIAPPVATPADATRVAPRTDAPTSPIGAMEVIILIAGLILYFSLRS